jgi:membrane protein YqaA with SNARE-associated domain
MKVKEKEVSSKGKKKSVKVNSKDNSSKKAKKIKKSKIKSQKKSIAKKKKAVRAKKRKEVIKKIASTPLTSIKKGGKVIQKGGQVIRKGGQVIGMGGKATIKGSGKAIRKGGRVIKRSGKKIKDTGLAVNKKRLEYQKKLAKRTGLIFLIGMAVIFIAVAVNYRYFESAATYMAEAYGLGGIFIISFLTDLFMQPIGPDVPLIGGMLGGINKYSVYLAAGLGSVAASMFGYMMGFFYGEFGIKKLYNEDKYLKWEKFYSKWGCLSVAIAAISPVPYVPFCWVSGIFKLKLWKFVLFALIPRMIRFYIVMLLAALVMGI